MFQVPMARFVVPLGQAHEHRDQTIPGEDQPPVLVRCVRPDPDRRQGDALGQGHL
ncbi:hypothetical protein [Muricoccus aerilatus]|uniref:hypothetical protein n=1 Tax=Muricoccus aerilatus TaxID=452982 RepID=UPI0012EB17A1|nr:hypothetical protein [Roseomonas aerilata]